MLQILCSHAQALTEHNEGLTGGRGLYFQKMMRQNENNYSIVEKSMLYQALGDYYFDNVLPNQALENYFCAVKQDDSNNAKFRIVELLQNLEMWQLGTDFLAKTSKTYYKTYYFIAL